MKAITFNYILVSILILLSIEASFAQTGKVLVTISNPTALALSINSTKELTSVNTEINDMLKSLDITGIAKAFPASRSKALENVYEISCNCDENDLLQEVARKSAYFSNPEIYTQATVLNTPNDFNLAITNDYALNLIGAIGAWDVTHGDSNVVIAISDANYHLWHEDLAGKYNFVGANPSTDYAHGTAVAVTAAGRTNNNAGKSSIGYNSSLQLRAMSFNEVLEASYSGARIVNMSWTNGCYYSQYCQNVMDEAYLNGTIVVAAAGNGGTCGGPDNLVYPSAYNHVISVTSVGPFDNHERYMGNPASAHQHNATVDICAPGYDVALTTAPGSYMTGNGTSFAAPYVSGTIALMLAVNKCLTPDEVEYILRATAVNIDAINPLYIGKLGAGRLNAAAAVLMASTYNTMVLNGENVFNCYTMDQGIVLDMSTVLAPYSVVWNTGASTPILNNVLAGSYSAIVRDSYGCVGFYSTVIDSLAPITINADLYPVLCHGENSGNIEIAAYGGFSNYTYEWSNGATTQNLYNLTAGNYIVSVTDGKGCTHIEDYLINEPMQLLSTVNHTDVSIFTNGSINTTVTGGTAPYIFSWSNGATTEDLSNLNVGFYEALIQDAKGCLTSVNALIKTNYYVINNNATRDDAISSTDNHSNGTTGETENNLVTLSTNEVSYSAVNVYPNPAVEHATVSWEGMQVQKIVLYDLSGKVVQSIDVQSGKNNLEINGVEQGEYLVKIQTKNNEQVVKKVSFL